MIHSFMLISFLMLVALTGSAVDDVSHPFMGEIVLHNAIVNSDFTVTTEFTDSITAVLQDAAKPPSPLKADVYAVPPHLVVLFGLWQTGTAENVQTAIQGISQTYARWAEGDDLTTSGALSHTCMKSISQQPMVVHYTQNCSFGDVPLPPSSGEECLRNLSLTFYTVVNNEPDPSARLRFALCNLLPTDCELISHGALERSQITFGGSSIMANIMPFTVISQNREATLATLVTYAQLTSVLAQHNIIYILTNGVQVFFKGGMQPLSIAGTPAQCAARMWYLIFLILLVPVVLIASHRLFHLGWGSGKKTIQKSERDIRAGVRLGTASWVNFCGNGGGGYQYRPLQDNRGGYALPQSGAQQFFLEQSLTGRRGARGPQHAAH
ncbi:hypothetical protein JKF63_01588 [Porcisia hertigi]|uniref:Uncharacterized protein n=1 Tax=Porcisia hertigi TaxID=2761500 RepID=A0A836HV24_9TRYP|nr:hypothetical protein JKF63_01588 [Porcisia hertigi]